MDARGCDRYIGFIDRIIRVFGETDPGVFEYSFSVAPKTPNRSLQLTRPACSFLGVGSTPGRAGQMS